MSRAGNRALADRVGVALFLAAWSMLVVSLAFAAISFRRAGVWQPLVAEVGVALPLLSCLAVVASSIALWRRRLALALAFAAALVGCQLLLLGAADGLADSGRHLMWLLAGFHLAHIAIGGLALVRRTLSASPAGLWAAYWHALAAAWLLFAGVLFL